LIYDKQNKTPYIEVFFVCRTIYSMLRFSEWLLENKLKSLLECPYPDVTHGGKTKESPDGSGGSGSGTQNKKSKFGKRTNQELNHVLKNLKNKSGQKQITNTSEIRQRILDGDYDKHEGLKFDVDRDEIMNKLKQKLKNVKGIDFEKIETGLEDGTYLYRGSIEGARVFSIDGNAVKVSKRDGDLYKPDNIVKMIEDHIKKKY